MDKGQIAVAMLLGSVLGIGGKELAEAALGVANADVAHPFVHAADLRQRPGEPNITVTVYATDPVSRVDLGRAVSCDVASPSTQASLEGCTRLLSQSCTWVQKEKH